MGDGVVQTAEQCDDGNVENGDGCSAGGEIEHGFYCQNEPSECASECGDGITASNEQCDDGNDSDGDNCSTVCIALDAISAQALAINVPL